MRHKTKKKSRRERTKGMPPTCAHANRLQVHLSSGVSLRPAGVLGVRHSLARRVMRTHRFSFSTIIRISRRMPTHTECCWWLLNLFHISWIDVQVTLGMWFHRERNGLVVRWGRVCPPRSRRSVRRNWGSREPGAVVICPNHSTRGPRPSSSSSSSSSLRIISRLSRLLWYC